MSLRLILLAVLVVTTVTIGLVALSIAWAACFMYVRSFLTNVGAVESLDHLQFILQGSGAAFLCYVALLILDRAANFELILNQIKKELNAPSDPD